jgi:hypothetical protein
MKTALIQSVEMLRTRDTHRASTTCVATTSASTVTLGLNDGSADWIVTSLPRELWSADSSTWARGRSRVRDGEASTGGFGVWRRATSRREGGFLKAFSEVGFFGFESLTLCSDTTAENTAQRRVIPRSKNSLSASGRESFRLSILQSLNQAITESANQPIKGGMG